MRTRAIYDRLRHADCVHRLRYTHSPSQPAVLLQPYAWVRNGPVGPFRYVRVVTVLLGYAKVSTAEQNADLQTDELKSTGCYEATPTLGHGPRPCPHRGCGGICLSPPLC